MIKNIIFDLNKVLVTYEYSTDHRIYHKLFGMDKFKLWSVKGRYKYQYGIGKISLQEYLTCILRAHHLPITHLKELRMLHKKEFKPVKGMKVMLNQLRQNYTLYVLAGDGCESVEFKIHDLGFEKYFKKVYCSCYEGYVKTQIQLYRIFLKKTGLNPKECLFIDDKKENIKLARSLGMHTILFKDAQQLCKELHKRTIV